MKTIKKPKTPYQILNIDNRATKKEILHAAAKALRERRFSGREIAMAQKQLLSPVTKALLDFICFVDPKPLKNSLTPLETIVSDETDMPRLSIFDKK